MWNSNVSPMSLVTLTAYWIDLSFTMQKAEPQGKQFYGSQMSSDGGDVNALQI